MSSFFAQTSFDKDNIDVNVLNEHILKEVNALRTKAKVDSLTNETLLKPASEDHVAYMSENEKMNHFQKTKEKKTPKNRVNFYGAQFHTVGENVQVNNLKNIPKELKLKNPPEEIDSYELLAKVLVLSWKNSPPHYANMISPDFSTTFTTIKINDKGEIYACQLFGSRAYEYPEEFKETVYPYKVQNDKKCRKCDVVQNLRGQIILMEDSTIQFVAESKKDLRCIGRLPWSSGVAADIVLKSQYPCGEENMLNGMRGVRGIPLDPVFKKGFKKNGNFFKKNGAYINLGKVPEWINEDFEVNLTLVRRKRTCKTIVFNTIMTDFDLNLSTDLYPDTNHTELFKTLRDTLSVKVNFDKSSVDLKDSTLYAKLNGIEERWNKETKVLIYGYSSIEGSTESNTILYQKRAQRIEKALLEKGCDSSKIVIKTMENYQDFRRDIIGTPFEYLKNFTDEELKVKLNKKSLADSLEPILKNHRYAAVTLTFEWKEKIVITPEYIEQKLQEAITANKEAEVINYQKIYSLLALKGEYTLEDLDKIQVPKEKKNVDLLFQRALLKAYLMGGTDSVQIFSISREELDEMSLLDERNKFVQTSLVLFDYDDRINTDVISMGLYYKEIAERKYLIPEWQAKILLKIAYIHDITLYFTFPKPDDEKYLYPEVQQYINKAKLNVDEMFELASYYTFFDQNDIAHKLTKNVIDETENPDNLVYFLKLIELTNLDISKKKKLDYIRKISLYAGKDFCKFFNSPNLNFQVLDDKQK